ncbi:hypothetical protein J2X12_002851 [Pseudarthrobacter oxydans]|uniref:Uncharacterized protein n=1 Tax=Pseudarthrobacter oxydans TaxID=1671 RepID=A0AAW8NFJ2_PSEOX|nr:hypothetical protein [Pseudarthrobacter oxydans]MDR7164813.1 hypothetical protein [Pseudarthrobacter oxydans]
MPRRYVDWRDWLRPRAAEQPAPLSAQEALIISAWSMTQEAWEALTDAERADKRFNFAKAPRFVS